MVQPIDSSAPAVPPPHDPETLPLSGVRVLDLTHVISGPFATMMLAEMGADVVKIERQEGEQLRNIPDYEGREGHKDYFNSVNVSKKSVTLNFKDPRDLRIAHDLSRHAHVVIENFAPGTAKRLNMGWDNLKALNPKLVYCSLSGYGQTGPFSKRSAIDPVIQAVSGLMSVNGFRDGPPTLVGSPLGDVIAGMCAAYAIVSCLHSVEQGGPGRYIDLSMQAALMYALGPRMSETLQAGTVPQRLGNQNFIRVPSDVCKSKDGRYAFIHCSNDRRWQALCRVMEKPDWAMDERFATMNSRLEHRDVLNGLVAGRFAERTIADWAPLFEAEDLPFMPINDYAEAIEHPQTEHRKQIAQVPHEKDGPVRLVGPPWIMTDYEPRIGPPPLLDENKREVLRDWLGWDGPRIEDYFAERRHGEKTG